MHGPTKVKFTMYYSEKTGNTCVTAIICLPAAHLTTPSVQAT